jgi:hypothetical protein
MKCTQYFSFVRQRPDRAIIKEEWILDTVKKPLKTEVQSDRRIRKWKYIEEVGRYLRVILLEDGKPFITLSLIETLRRKKNENSIFLRYRYSID